MKPSGLYRSELWRVGLTAARFLPVRFLQAIGRALALTYWAAVPARRHIVLSNLLPVLNNDFSLARRKTRALFLNFGDKLADLWRYEAGLSLQPLLPPGSVGDQFSALKNSAQGTLLITPHVGNWEFGAPLLAAQGIGLLVITQAEPQNSFTELRKQSRSRWGIETLVIGENPFVFVEVIRRLEAGAVVALLIDRPASNSAVTIQLFGRKFQASIAAAELARASGCNVLPVCLPRLNGAYQPVLLPKLEYSRAELGKREARVQFTQEIMRSFEPLIRQYIDQWYHFVPLWQSERNGL